jgi:hypothetical protein
MNQLAKWMQTHNIDDAEMAAKIGINPLTGKPHVSRVQINRLRRDINRPRPDLARKLEAITSIPAGDFIFGAAA